MGINCMFQCLTLILSQSPLGQVSSWRMFVIQNTIWKVMIFLIKETRANWILILFLLWGNELHPRKNLVYVMKDKLLWSISDKIQGKNQCALIPLSESSLPVNEGTQCFCLESCILIQRKTVCFTKGEIAWLLRISKWHCSRPATHPFG